MALKTAAAVVLLAAIFAADAAWAAVMGPGFVEKNTPYNHVWIYDEPYRRSHHKIRYMQIANEFSSSMFLEGDELVFDYTKYYRLARHLRPSIDRALMIGGAGYSYPKAFLTEYPKGSIDVVEIDPGLTELAKRYFRLREDPRLKIFHEDGRIFLNRATQKYDVIYGDAFKSTTIPHQLVTVEAVRRMHAVLEPGGVVLINVISALKGERAKFLLAERSTLKAVFPQVYVFQIDPAMDPGEAQNLMLVAIASEEKPKFYSSDRVLNGYLQNLRYEDFPDARVLTDDFAPVEFFATKILSGGMRSRNALRLHLAEFFAQRRLRKFMESKGG